jgi:sec-independent protein translocase protein TatA
MGIGMRELVVILLVVLLVFGAKKLRTVGSDLGAAVRGFKKAMNEGENEDTPPPRQIPADKADAEFAEASRDAKPRDAGARDGAARDRQV